MKVNSSWLAAKRASTESDACWRQLVAAIETSAEIESRRSALLRALAQQRYAWAVHHGTVADAGLVPESDLDRI